MYINDYSLLARAAFADRWEAGEALGKELLSSTTKPDIVLGLTRGGVPVAAAVARTLGVPLDIIVVKKIGAPFSLELAIGAICSDGSRVLHPDYVRELEIPGGYVERTSKAMLEEAKAAEGRYRSGAQEPGLRGQTVLLVDDGIATGSSMEVAVTSVRNRGAKRVIVAVPVASPESIKKVGELADEVIALRKPDAFFAVGQFYNDFSPITDDEVVRLVTADRQAHAA